MPRIIYTNLYMLNLIGNMFGVKLFSGGYNDLCRDSNNTEKKKEQYGKLKMGDGNKPRSK